MGMSNYVLDEQEKEFNHLCQTYMNKGLTVSEAFAAALDDLDAQPLKITEE